uniref:Uncharacterized protein n=1 Tax=Anguilla anguilla TaxID=7936 RepID=A0A0E9PVI6_ANGAN
MSDSEHNLQLALALSSVILFVMKNKKKQRKRRRHFIGIKSWFSSVTSTECL